MVRFRDGGSRCSFNYTSHLEHVIRLWCSRYPQLCHIDMDRVLVSVVKCRTRLVSGTCATITSLRYPTGRASFETPAQAPQLERIFKDGREVLYLVKFFLPRFHDLPLGKKVETILHELHHVDPKFNGELRTFGGARWAHGSSQKAFEKTYETLRQEVLAHLDPLDELFLNCSFAALLRRYGDIYGQRYRWQRLVEQNARTVARRGRKSVLPGVYSPRLGPLLQSRQGGD